MNLKPKVLIKALLENKGITQADIAKRLGQTQANVSQVISGKVKNSPEIQRVIAETLDMPYAELWGKAA